MSQTVDALVDGAPPARTNDPGTGLLGVLNRAVLERARELAIAYLEGLPDRPVGPDPGAGHEELLAALGGPLPAAGEDPISVLEQLASGVEPGLVASAGPRYFGFVIGGSLPSALAADWLTAAWDQNACLYVSSPAASVVEEIAAGWLTGLLGLPDGISMGFVTGATMANFTALAAARHAVLRAVGWDAEADGLQDAPKVTIVASEQAHTTLFHALRLLGFGRRQVRLVPADLQGRMRPAELARLLDAAAGPVIVAAQAGNVNSGAFDPLGEIADLVDALPNAWLHVDGAFGLWAAASPAYRPLVAGAERADSWATDAQK